MENETSDVSSDQILGYLKNKYLSKPEQHTTKTPRNDNNNEVANKLPVGEESDLSGEKAENSFLLNKLEGVQSELTKWLEILKSKIKS